MLTFYHDQSAARRFVRVTGLNGLPPSVFEISVVSGADEIRKRGFVEADTPRQLSDADWAEILPDAREIDPEP